MSGAEASPVAELRQRLSEVAAALSGARALAESRAEELRHDPTEARMAQRREAAEKVELLDLQRLKIEQDLGAAEEQARRERMQELLASQGPIQARAGDADAAVWRTLGEHEGALGALLGCRQELKKLNAQLAQLGYEGDAIQPCPRPQQNEYRRRTEALVKSYNQATHPLGVMPVRVGE